ncbi:hypothetical protein J1N35_013861 [Gossypium stocksii]|uniref:Uncharacterized protein n=1 Tax=Gossypium stocksii TaxID=47602 RepID=A0A9D3VT63_9ROSI|nr:hypothetical protein J1N35_013861 [Gossypium stocksii]
MEDVIKYLTQGKGNWNYRLDTRLLTNFNQAMTFPVTKMWLQFIGTRIAPTLNVSNVNVFRVILLYVTALCQKAEVPEKVRKGASGSIEARLDGMISWMQETESVLQEFKRMNGLRTLNFPKDMFSLTPTHYDQEANFKEEGATQEYLRTVKEYEAAF